MPSRENFPFTNVPAESIAAWRERGLLREIQKWFAKFPMATVAIDDDCAAIPVATGTRLTSVDSVIFGRHFDESVPAFFAGQKLVRRNLSDIAACAGTPTDAVIALVMSNDVSRNWLREFYRGMLENCEKFGVKLVGGDVASVAGTQFFSASMTINGVAGTRILRRAGTQIGDLVCVTGTLGGSIFGKHFLFEPRLEIAQKLAGTTAVGTPIAHACIDLTDGLAKDLPEIVPAGAVVAIDLAKIPLSPDANGEIARAFVDGEDYELLFTIARGNEHLVREICGNAGFSVIGEILDEREERRDERIFVSSRERENPLAGTPFSGGFEHF